MIWFIFTDQWSPLNPEGKKTYDRHFLLQLQNNSASQKKPEGLPIILQRVRDIVRRDFFKFVCPYNFIEIFINLLLQ